MTQKITLIGGGRLASALIQGLLSKGYHPSSLCVTHPNQKRCDALAYDFGIKATTHNRSAAESADVVILCVKPTVIHSVCIEIAPVIQKNTLVISVATGVTLSALKNWLNTSLIVRAMPNTAALINASITALFTDNQQNLTLIKLANDLLSSLGQTIWVDCEEKLAAVTAVSGSGPAYFFAFMEALEKAAVILGLNESEASLLVKATALGAAKLANESGQTLVTLRESVTSKGGTTEQALAIFSKGDLNTLVLNAASAAKNRAESLARETSL